MRSYLFLKVREYVLGSTKSDRITWGVSLVLVVALLYVAGLLKFWLAFLVLGVAAAGTMYFLIDLPLLIQRRGPVERAEDLLRTLRWRGVPEESLRQFVCKSAGRHWEEFYETLFGYEALLAARRLWSLSESGEPRPKFAAWRDPLVEWIDARQQARRAARERELLEETERKRLQAEGATEGAAQEQAAEAAAVLVAAAAELKQHAEQQNQPAIPVAIPVPPTAIPVSARTLVEAPEQARRLTPEERIKLQGKPPSRVLVNTLGPRARFVAGAILLLLFVLWVSRNELIPGEATDFQDYGRKLEAAESLAFLPGPLGVMLSGFHAGLAGLVLAASALSGKRAVVFFAFVAVAVLLVGPLVFPEVMGVSPRYVALLAGVAVLEFAFVFLRVARQPR
jgi:hypothetical protein